MLDQRTRRRQGEQRDQRHESSDQETYEKRGQRDGGETDGCGSVGGGCGKSALCVINHHRRAGPFDQ